MVNKSVIIQTVIFNVTFEQLTKNDNAFYLGLVWLIEEITIGVMTKGVYSKDNFDFKTID